MSCHALSLKFVPLPFAFFCILLLPNLLLSQELDPPHDSEFASAGCLSCHDMAAYDQPNLISPGTFTFAADNIDWTLYNSICEGCHDSVTIAAHYHSSRVTSTKYGTWTVQCIVCHNQHTQEQDRAFGTNYGKFIRRNIDLSKILDNAPPVGVTIPGKSGIRKVKFTGPTGPNSFADCDGTVDGICEVCHTQTSHFRNDGSNCGTGVHTGYQGSNCMQNCHPADQGLEPDYECLDCHADPANTEANVTRASVRDQFNGNSHHVQRGDFSLGTITSTDCYQCHWEADVNGKITSYHGATPGSPIDLVIYGPATRPEIYTPGTSALPYTPDGSREEITGINDHCLSCHSDQNNVHQPFNDGKSPNAYAWDGSSIDARYSQTGTARWGKYYNSGGSQNALYAAEKDVTKAFSAHGNTQNNFGGGYSTVTSCYGPSITVQTCADFGGTWNVTNGQCDTLSLSQCTQNYCENLLQTTCENAVGTWGSNTSMCKNVSQYTCTVGYCFVNSGPYNDSHDYDCNNRGGTYKQGASGWICTDITSGQCTVQGWTWQAMGGSWHVTDSKYMQGVDYLLRPTRGGLSSAKVACFDCHNSHGSNVVGTDTENRTTSYVSATASGGILKNVSDGKGGYETDYMPVNGGNDANKNKRNAGASLCLNCHLTADADASGLPWSYDGTFGASDPVIGYFDSEYLEPGGAGPQLLFPYKGLTENAGGHFGASKSLNSTPMHQINGLCTPCHDPHGVSPTHVGSCDQPEYVIRDDCVNNGGNWTIRQEYGLPLLKGTWLTSPYREDAAPGSTTLAAGWSGRNVRSNAGFHIDQNTFADWDFSSTAGISENVNVFAGLCLQCHLDGEINPNSDNSWNSMDRIHNSVKGWDDNDGIESVVTKHRFSCSKCHTPHNGSALPRLMVTNCMNFKHRGRVGSGGLPHSGNYTVTGDLGGGSGSGKFPGGGSGTGNGDWAGIVNFEYGFGGVACHDSVGSGSWPDNQNWNQVTPWTNLIPGLTAPTATVITTTSANLGATVLSDAGWNINERGTVWNTTGSTVLENVLAEGISATGTFSHLRGTGDGTGNPFPAGTKIFYRGYAVNNNGTGYSPRGSFYTEPLTQASIVSIAPSTPSTTTATVNFSRGDGDGVIVLMRQGSAVVNHPIDGTYTSYTGNAVFGNGTEMGFGNDTYVVYKGEDSGVTSVEVTGLYPGTDYHVAIYSYAGTADTSGLDQGTNYINSPAVGNTTTDVGAPVLFAPTATSIDIDSADLGADVVSTGGAPIIERGTVWATATNPVYPTDNPGTISGTLGVFSHNRTGLNTVAKIYYRGYARNSSGFTGYSPQGSFYTEPNQALGVSFTPSATDSTKAEISWTRGNGDGIIVLMKMGSAVDQQPADGTYTSYTANPVFGSGTEIVPGSGTYIVYKGNGNDATTVTISGLWVGATYYVKAFEFAGQEDTSGVDNRDQGTNYNHQFPPTASGATTLLADTYTYSFGYTGSPEQVYIPLSATGITFRLAGAGGGGGRYEDYQDQTPGKSGDLVVTSSTATDSIVTVYVGGGGIKGGPTDIGSPGGWGKPSGVKGSDGDNSSGGAGGGGASAIYDGTTSLAVAKGGNGGNSDSWEWCGGTPYTCDGGIGGDGGPGGGTSQGDLITVEGGVNGGAAPNYAAPSDGGDGWVEIEFTIL